MYPRWHNQLMVESGTCHSDLSESTPSNYSTQPLNKVKVLMSVIIKYHFWMSQSPKLPSVVPSGPFGVKRHTKHHVLLNNTVVVNLEPLPFPKEVLSLPWVVLFLLFIHSVLPIFADIKMTSRFLCMWKASHFLRLDSNSTSFSQTSLWFLPALTHLAIQCLGSFHSCLLAFFLK